MKFLFNKKKFVTMHGHMNVKKSKWKLIIIINIIITIIITVLRHSTGSVQKSESKLQTHVYFYKVSAPTALNFMSSCRPLWSSNFCYAYDFVGCKHFASTASISLPPHTSTILKPLKTISAALHYCQVWAQLEPNVKHCIYQTGFPLNLNHHHHPHQVRAQS